MTPRSVSSPDSNVAINAIVNVQTATTRCKAIIIKGVSLGWDDKQIATELNTAIANTVKDIDNPQVAIQTRKALVTACRKWHYELTQTYQILNRNFANAVPSMSKIVTNNPAQILTEFRHLLDSGTNPATPVISDYYRKIKIALKALSAEPPQHTVNKQGKVLQTSLRNSAELAVRYQANMQDLNALRNEGVRLVWTTSHPNCSPRCYPYQGRLWSLDGTRGVIDGNRYEPIEIATHADGDQNGIISGYGCRHRLVEYQKGSRAPKEFTPEEIKREYAIDKMQRSYENKIRQLKTEEVAWRESGAKDIAHEYRVEWQKLTKDYQVKSIAAGRAYYPYRCVIDKDIERQSLAVE